MKRLSVFIQSLLVLMILASVAWAQDIVPTMINYQGFLTDQNGKALTSNYNIIFRLYPDTSIKTTWDWSEEQSVEVVNGLFNVLLGSSTPLTTDIFNGDKFLGITVGTETEMTPRMRLASVAYSMHADQAMQSQSAAYASNIIIQGEPAFRFKRYNFGADRKSVDHKTTFKTAEWAAAIVGFNAGYGDITESGSHELWEVRMKKDTDEYWHIFADSPTSQYPDWIIDVMFVRIDLASMEGYSAED